MRDPSKHYSGKICSKHPELHGERRRLGGVCVGCGLAATAKYAKENLSSGRGIAENTRVGYVCELLVAADMNARCGRAYPNPEPQTKDDIYAKTSIGWRSVQCKKITVNRKTGHTYQVNKHRMRAISSDIVAEVDLDNFRVRYRLGTGERMPPELPTVMEPLCSRFVLFAAPQER